MDPRIKVAAARLLCDAERESAYTPQQLEKVSGLVTGGIGALIPALISGKGEDVLAGGLGGYGGGVSGGAAAGLMSAGSRHLIDTLGERLPQGALNNELSRSAAKWGVSALSGLYAPRLLKKLKRWHMEDEDEE